MWTHVILYFFVGLVLCAPFGVASYFLGCWFRRVTPKWSKVADCIFALMGAVMLGPSLLLVGALCYAGALAQRSLEGGTGSVFKHFVRMLSSTTFPTLVIAFSSIELSLMFPSTFAALGAKLNSYVVALTGFEVGALYWGAVLGIITAPTLVPIGLGFWHSSKMRPGLDRPLLQGESLQ